MWEFHAECMEFLNTEVHHAEVGASLKAYLDYVIARNM